ncbi:phosphatidate cytidylyltransferase [Umbelopsis sp. AD052]|nr:phosphatidate cytidylyltransferase [Umbelopsis sp. AD052]
MDTTLKLSDGPSQRDLVGFIVMYTMSFAVIAASELMRRFCGVPSHITRKIIHVGAGVCVLFVISLFDHWQYAIIPHSTFIVVNAVVRRWKILKSMEPPNAKSWGTVYFCISVSLLFFLVCAKTYNDGLKWTIPQYVYLTGIMAMTLGDAFAAIIGERFGKRRHYVPVDQESNVASGKTYEGSAACFVAIFLGTLMVGWICSVDAWADAFVCATVGTLFEAISPWGTDNLTVPFSVCSVMYAIRM